MNTLVRLIMSIGIFFAIIGILSALSLFPYITALTNTLNWLFGALLPFQGILNLKAIFGFMIQLAIFELAMFSFMIATKLFNIFHGHGLTMETKTASYQANYDSAGEFKGNSVRTTSSSRGMKE